MSPEFVADRIEAFVRMQFQVAADDPQFSRFVPLFDRGYIDSVGVMELLEFLSEEFCVELPDEALANPVFSTIDGISKLVATLAMRVSA